MRPTEPGGRVLGMKTLIIALVVAWILLSVIGAVVEGLLWLTAIAVVALLVTAAVGWFKLRRAFDRRTDG